MNEDHLPVACGEILLLQRPQQLAYVRWPNRVKAPPVAARARPVALATWPASIAARPAAAPLTPAGLRGAAHGPATERHRRRAAAQSPTEGSSLGLDRLTPAHRPTGPKGADASLRDGCAALGPGEPAQSDGLYEGDGGVWERNIISYGDDVVSMWETSLTVVGTVLSLLGTICAVVAYLSTWQEHADGPLLPRFANRIARVRNRILRLIRRPRGRTVALSGAVELSVAMSARAVVTGPAIPPDVDLEQQVKLLIRRVENLERQAADDRSHNARELNAVRAVADKVSAEATQASAAVETKAKSMVLDTVRIQLLGLTLVGSGTIFLAAAGFVGG